VKFKSTTYTAANINQGTGGWPGVACKSVDPLFVSLGTTFSATDLLLQSASPGVDAGAFPYQTTSAGNGTSSISLTPIVTGLDATRVFRAGDSIMIEGSGTYTISSVTAASITLSTPATFAAGKGVWFPWSGSKPNIGWSSSGPIAETIPAGPSGANAVLK
jgi:hypothetical protein